MNSIGMTQQQEHTAEVEQDLVPIGSDEPRYRSDEFEVAEEYRSGNYWKTEEGFLAIDEMEDTHLVNARRHAMQKLGDLFKKQADIERKAEIMLLKYGQLTHEAKKRRLFSHQNELVDAE